MPMNVAQEYQLILDFWFGESYSSYEVIEQQSSLWWGKDTEVDREIRNRFGESLKLLIVGDLNDWKQLPEGHLAMIILADQFSRSIYRDTAMAFAQDEIALTLTLEGIENGIDLQLDLLQRVFFYLPLEHSELMTMQQRSVEMQKLLADSAPVDARGKFRDFHEYAILHLEVIEKYGRYPHRNAIFGRQSTVEELEYLAQPGSGF